MKTQYITAVTLLVVITLCGCSKTVGSGQVIVDSYETVEAAESSAVIAENVSFSAGNKTPLPIDTPEPSSSAEPPVTAKPTQAQGKSTPKETASPKSKATPKPTASPKPTTTPKSTAKPTVSPKPTTVPTPIATPRPTATPMTTAIPAPVSTSTPMATPTPTATPAPPMVFFTPELQAGRTICNTCGADITGNIAAHGDGHLLNGENFSYRVE